MGRTCRQANEIKKVTRAYLIVLLLASLAGLVPLVVHPEAVAKMSERSWPLGARGGSVATASCSTALQPAVATLPVGWPGETHHEAQVSVSAQNCVGGMMRRRLQHRGREGDRGGGCFPRAGGRSTPAATSTARRKSRRTRARGNGTGRCGQKSRKCRRRRCRRRQHTWTQARREELGHVRNPMGLA